MGKCDIETNIENLHSLALVSYAYSPNRLYLMMSTLNTPHFL